VSLESAISNNAPLPRPELTEAQRTEAPEETKRVRKAIRNARYEYDCVCRMTSQPRLMLEARETCICEADAIALLELLAEYCGCPAPKVTWGRRAWARRKDWRVHLCRSPVRLHVGVVVHEFAHLVACRDDGERSKRLRHHGPAFAEALDRLLLVSAPVWRTRRFNYERTLRRIEFLYDETEPASLVERVGQTGVVATYP